MRNAHIKAISSRGTRVVSVARGTRVVSVARGTRVGALLRGTRVLAALALGAATLVAACGQGRSPASGPIAQSPAQTRAAEQRVDTSGRTRVALLLPITAANAGAAREAQGIADAARMASSDLRDPRFDLEVYDTGGDQAGANAAAARALADGAALILGPFFGPNAKAVGASVKPAGVNVISFSTWSGAAGDNVWLIGMLSRAEADRIVGYAAASGYRSLGVFYPQTAYGRDALASISAAARRAGAVVAVSGGYDRSFEGIQEAGRTYAQDHLASGAGAVVLPDTGDGLRSAAAFLDFYGVSPREGKFLGLGGWSKRSVTKEAALRGGWFAGPDPARVAQFAQRFRAVYGRAPSALAPLGYDAVAAAGALLKEARAQGSDTPFSAAAITDPGGFLGVNGAFRFTPDGLNQRSLAILEVGADGFTVIDPAPGGFAGGPGA